MFKEKMKELRKLIADKEALTASMGSELRSLLEAEKLDEAKAKGWTVTDMKLDWKTIYPEIRK